MKAGRRPHGFSTFFHHCPGVSWLSVSPRFSDVFRIPVVSGRAFGDQDNGAADRAVMIGQAMANVGSDRAGERRDHRAEHSPDQSHR
jgi:hypothetical protein